MIFPALEKVKELARDANTIPLCRIILADTETPVSVWMKLFRSSPYSFLLESVTGGELVARYSFLGGDPFMVFRANGTSWRIEGNHPESGDAEPITRLRRLLGEFRPARVEGLPRFAAGAVGFFSYDTVRLTERIPDKNPREEVLDEIFFGFYRDIIVFDNREHRILLISNIFTDKGTPVDEAYAETVRRLGEIEDRLAARLSAGQVEIRSDAIPVSNVKRGEYEAAVEKCKEYIRAGDIFQVVLSQRFAVSVEADPFDLYRMLRIVNPSPYMYFLSCDTVSVIGASPEMLVRVEDGLVETRPIAGTRPRGNTADEDACLAAELLQDPKEIAEHVMLIDLGRNDLGRVCEYGSVKADDVMHIERYSHVMHMVTNVGGKLRQDRDALDALFSCFPAGTLTGAPKIRAMEIIDELEPSRRGLYGGALGYIDFGGNLDSCIVIRTIVYKGTTAYIQAGAGIVADSVPAREYEESVNKATALFTAIKNVGRITGRE